MALVKLDAEPLADHALEVHPPPAHDAILLPFRPGRDDGGELGQLLGRQAWLGPCGPVVEQALGPAALKRWTQSRSVCRSIPPTFAADPRSIPSRTAAKDNSRRLWLTSFERRASARRSSAE